jgi:WD40 repeat protein
VISRMSQVHKPVVTELFPPCVPRALCCVLCLAWAACDAVQVLGASSPAPARQFGHGSHKAAAFAPDGRTVLLAGSNAQLFDVETGSLLRQFLGHSDTISSAAFLPDGNVIATGSRDGTVRFWDVQTGEDLVSLEHPEAVVGMGLSPDGAKVITGLPTNQGWLWEISSRSVLGEFEAGGSLRGGPSPLAFSPDGALFATAASPGVIVLRDANTSQELGRIETGVHPVNAVAFSPDSARILAALGSFTMTARLYDLQTKEILWTAEGHTGNWDNTTRLWDAETGEELRRIAQALLSGAAISPDSRFLVTLDARIWDAGTGELILALPNTTRATSSLAVSSDGALILTGNTDGAARLWETASGTLIHAFTGHPGSVLQAVFSLDGTVIITASIDGTVKWWDILSREEVRSVKFPAGSNVAISSDLTRLLTSNSNHNRVFDLHSGEEIHMFRTLPAAIEAPLAFSPDGTRVVVTDAGRYAKIVLTETGEEVRSIDTGEQIGSLQFSPDGAQSLTVGMNNAAVWEAGTGERVRRFHSGGSRIKVAVFSPDRNELLMLRADGFVLLWNLENGQLAGIIENKGLGFPNFAAFSPDGNWIFAGDGSTLLMWDRKAAETVVPLRLTQVRRFQGNTFLTVEGPAAAAFTVFVESSPALSPEAVWEKEGSVFIKRQHNSYELRFPWRPSPQRFFRAYVLPIE